MAMKTLTDFKRLTIIGVVLVVFPAGEYWIARAASSNQDAAIVAQNETQTATAEKKAPSSAESKEPGIQTDKTQESTAVKKRPLEDFQPSEKIEAEQAVDFPYDI